MNIHLISIIYKWLKKTTDGNQLFIIIGVSVYVLLEIFLNRIREEFRPRIVIRHSGFGTGVPQDIVTQQDWLYNFWRHHLYNYTIHYKRERKRTLPQSEFLRRKYLKRMKNGEIGSSSQSGGHRGRIMYDPYKDGDPPSDYVFPMF